jgi:hypothetical protein
VSSFFFSLFSPGVPYEKRRAENRHGEGISQDDISCNKETPMASLEKRDGHGSSTSNAKASVFKWTDQKSA